MKPPETKESTRHLKYTFKETEITQIGRNLADKVAEISALENDKKRVVKDFDAKISAAESESSILTSNLRSGYEFRMVKCTETMAAPGPGKKTVVRQDTGEVVGIEPMTVDELQLRLKWEDEQKKTQEEEKAKTFNPVLVPAEPTKPNAGETANATDVDFS